MQLALSRTHSYAICSILASTLRLSYLAYYKISGWLLTTRFVANILEHTAWIVKCLRDVALERGESMSQPIRVLIVDDNARTRDGLRALLATRSDIEVVGEATNGRDAMRLIAELHPAIVVMDLEMPLMNSIDATRLIKQRWPSVNLIVVTSSAAKRSAALAAGADDFIIKGDAPSRLLAALRVAGAADR
jgi:CheY-like chemotaxis protein